MNKLILSEYEDINSLLLKPIVATQRIKYTCIHVSTNYIALGSTSGSIYLFTREPCTFQQLIPQSEGPVTHVLISPDEKTLALSTKRGSICIINIKPVKLLSIISNGRDTVITCLCWNEKSSEIYVGDNNGRVSTVVLSIFTVNGMFQAPSCALMHLDSSVVQMDYSSHYLLVSTLTRCYICDTSHEQFKQIGNKARDGEYGGCFFKNNEQVKSSLPLSSSSSSLMTTDASEKIQKSVGLTMMSLNDQPVDDNLIIYCTRPGCRLWEVNVMGTVVKTHQFKEALQPPVQIFKSSSIKSSYCDNDSSKNTQTINFSRLQVINNKYLLSYTTNNIFIIDPINTTIISIEFNNIFMINVIDDKIYIMTTLGTFHYLLLSTSDYLILKFYDHKLFDDCLQLCKLYRNDLTNDADINNVLLPIVTSIQSNFTPQRLNSGIVVVNSGHGLFNNDEYNNYFFDINDKNNSEIKQKVDNESDEIVLTNEFKNMTINGSNGDIKNNYFKVNDSTNESNDGDLKSQFKTEFKNIQSDVEPIYELINSLKNCLNEDTDKIINDIIKNIMDIKNKYKQIELKQFVYEIIRSVERHYFNVLLENVMIDLYFENNFVIEEITRAFIDLNSSADCICEKKLFKNNYYDMEPKFIEVGINLLKLLVKVNKSNAINICCKIPYMWREYFQIQIDNKFECDIIPLCLQTRDNKIIANLFILIDDDRELWNYAAESYKFMEKGICLMCKRKYKALISNDNELFYALDWSEIARFIIKKKNIDTAFKFIKNLEKLLPHVKLKENIYQSLIFTKLLEQHGLDHTVEFDGNKLNNDYNSICSSEVQKTLKESLEKDIEKEFIKKNLFGSGVHHWGIKFKTKSSICSSCTLSLQTPVLLGNNGISIFPCGHAYHVNCLIQKKSTKCFLHP
ncbi:uncharacterized protein LOC103570500 isoform X1 [Microplitis demolitor]|uniref:uncharacterized protein LOC103570500 isoform X1 n=1 Tax=Microplitis demolitor TaxID=69319 RepID=UPI0004CD562D|nr:uncharacterized protein LOC103570500 isoform X1 [Microplitis demolitor]